MFGSAREIRTLTDQNLNLVPLPIGLGRRGSPRIRTGTVQVLSLPSLPVGLENLEAIAGVEPACDALQASGLPFAHIASRGSSRNRTCHGLIYSQPCHLGSSTPLAEDAGIEPAGPFSRASLAKRLLTIRLYSMCGSDRNRTRYGVTRDCFQDSSPPLASLPSTRYRVGGPGLCGTFEGIAACGPRVTSRRCTSRAHVRGL